jgi:hypothetical protein
LVQLPGTPVEPQRIWHICYLRPVLGRKRPDFRDSNTHEVQTNFPDTFSVLRVEHVAGSCAVLFQYEPAAGKSHISPIKAHIRKNGRGNRPATCLILEGAIDYLCGLVSRLPMRWHQEATKTTRPASRAAQLFTTQPGKASGLPRCAVARQRVRPGSARSYWPRARSIARSTARALLPHSSNSLWGTESATIPAPACTEPCSPCSRRVRIAMQESRLPE